MLVALREEPYDLTVVVTIADDGGSSGELRRRRGGPAVGDLRRALIALAGDEAPLARALRRPITTQHLGRHPVGNLVIRSLEQAFGDLSAATNWLACELAIRARVLPATVDTVSLLAEAGGGIIFGESAIGASPAVIRRLRFRPGRPKVTDAALDAIAGSDYVLLGPGSLFTSVLAVCALPDVAAALDASPARVIWICNLEAGAGETTGLTARNHLAALRRHGVRVDAVLYDPGAELSFAPGHLARQRVEAIARPLMNGRRGVHDCVLLRQALSGIFGGDRQAASAAS